MSTLQSPARHLALSCFDNGHFTESSRVDVVAPITSGTPPRSDVPVPVDFHRWARAQVFERFLEHERAMLCLSSRSAIKRESRSHRLIKPISVRMAGIAVCAMTVKFHRFAGSLSCHAAGTLSVGGKNLACLARGLGDPRFSTAAWPALALA